MKLFIICFTLLCVSLLPVFGQRGGNPENFCRNGAFPKDSEDFRVAKIKAAKGERVYFFDDDRNCPNDQNCRRKAYLIDKDEVLISRTFGNYFCAWYQPRKGSEVVGWLPKDKIDFPVANSDNFASWLGDWTFYDNALKISRGEKPDSLRVSGNALWKGRSDNLHVGEVDSTGMPDDKQFMRLTDGICEIRLYLVSRYLVVADNNECGGMNVSFSGVYLKKSTR
jgi:hypothetical protein